MPSLALTIPPPVPLLAIGLLVAWLWAIAWTMRRLRRPPRRTYAWAVAKGLPGEPGELSPALRFEAFTFRGPSGATFAGWDIAGLRADGPLVVLSHGWGEGKVAMLERVAALAPLASRLVVWDMRGHGESEGLSDLGVNEPADLLALLETVRGEGADVILYGFSLGAGVSLAAARELAERPGGPCVRAILEAPYRLASTPARAVLGGLGFPAGVTLDAALAWIGWRVGIGPSWRGFDRRLIASQTKGAVLGVIVGGSDPISPPAGAREIAEASGAACREIEGAGHLDLWSPQFRAATLAAVESFAGGETR